MLSPDQKKWDARYRNHPSSQPQAAPVLQQNLHLLPGQGDALDLACGLGGNAELLARCGLTTSAWDISPVALQQLETRVARQGLQVSTRACDVVSDPPKENSFDVIVVARFLDRKLFPALQLALKPQGILFYQTFTQENTGARGPLNKDYLLRIGELLQAFSSLRILSFRDEGCQGEITQGLRNESWIIVKKDKAVL